MKKSDINLNINKEDFNVNDYIFVWDVFKERPSKIIIYENFELSKFDNLIKKYSNILECSLVEVIPYNDDKLLNERNLIRINNDLFLSYTTLDSSLTESFVNEIYIYFNKSGRELANDIVGQLNDLVTEEQAEDQISNLFSLSFESTGYEERAIEVQNIDLDNINLYFNNDTFKRTKKLIKNINKNKKCLSIIHGERGVGKTSLIKYISNQVDKKCFFVPCSSFETTIINPEFRNFLLKNPNSLLILDDSDIYFSEMYSKSNIFTNIILQLVDGLDSDSFNVQIISVLNVDNVDDIDHSLLDCNNLLDIIQVGYLSSDKIKSLSRHLDKKINSNNSMKLSEFFRKKQQVVSKKEIGF